VVLCGMCRSPMHAPAPFLKRQLLHMYGQCCVTQAKYGLQHRSLLPLQYIERVTALSAGKGECSWARVLVERPASGQLPTHGGPR